MTKLPSETTNGLSGIERQRHQQALARLDRYARRLDSQFRIPFTRIRFGLDPLIGLLPGIGDLVGLGLSLYLVVEAIRLGAGPALVMRMLTNLGLEFLVGLVPVLGDAFDLLYRANDRNAAMLRRHIERQLEPPRQGRSWLSWLMVATCLVLVALLAYRLGQLLLAAGGY
ncbi:MAG: DUF4112 domain-containing protein [Pseudomonadales bacterium]|nr:DUF4112 domain-containing protein [Pseudomonadales bacterium]